MTARPAQPARVAPGACPLYPRPVTTAAAIIIGDEILSGKVRDVNTPLLVDLLCEIGVSLQRLVVIGDDIATIADEVRGCSAGHHVVVTSGGLGPTHDDRTVEAVAAAFDVRLVSHPEIEALIRFHWGPRLTAAALRMALVPEGARLLHADDRLLPLVVIRNLYLLPGVPELFRVKLQSLRQELRGQRPHLRSLFLRSDESAVAHHLTLVDQEFPAVKIGSYPRFEPTDHSLWVTLESLDRDALEGAVARLIGLLPADELVRTEP